MLTTLSALMLILGSPWVAACLIFCCVYVWMYLGGADAAVVVITTVRLRVCLWRPTLPAGYVVRQVSAMHTNNVADGIVDEKVFAFSPLDTLDHCVYVGEGMNVSVAVTRGADGYRYFHGAGRQVSSNCDIANSSRRTFPALRLNYTPVEKCTGRRMGEV